MSRNFIIGAKWGYLAVAAWFLSQQNLIWTWIALGCAALFAFAQAMESKP